jgi:hypothetical protein
MSRWPRGEAQIEQLIAIKRLQQVIGDRRTAHTSSGRRRAP